MRPITPMPTAITASHAAAHGSGAVNPAAGIAPMSIGQSAPNRHRSMRPVQPCAAGERPAPHSAVCARIDQPVATSSSSAPPSSRPSRSIDSAPTPFSTLSRPTRAASARIAVISSPVAPPPAAALASENSPRIVAYSACPAVSTSAMTPSTSATRAEAVIHSVRRSRIEAMRAAGSSRMPAALPNAANLAPKYHATDAPDAAPKAAATAASPRCGAVTASAANTVAAATRSPMPIRAERCHHGAPVAAVPCCVAQ